MLTISEALKNETNINESVLTEISDILWEMGNLTEIQKEVSPELF